MPLVRKIVLNIGWLSGAQFVDYLLRAVIGVLVARYLGVEQYGAFAPAMSLALMGAVFTDLGLRMTVLRTGSTDPADLRRVTGIAAAAKGILIALVYLLLLAFTAATGLGGLEFTLVAILGAGIFLGSYAELFTAILQARERMALWGAVTVGFRLILLCAVLTVVLNGGDVVAIGLAYAAANVLGALVALAMAGLTANRAAAANPAPGTPVSILLRRSLQFGAAAVLMALFLQADIVMLRLLLGEAAGRYQSGLYGVAFRLIALLYAVPIVVQSAVMPRLYGYASDPARLGRAYSVLFRWSLAVSAALSAVAAALAPILVVLLFGEEFGPAAPAFALLAAGLWLHQLNYVCGDTLYALDLQAWRAWSLAAVVALNIGLNLFMIPAFGAVGAALSTLIAELLLLLLLYAAAQRRVPLKSAATFTAPLVLSILAGICLWAVSLISPASIQLLLGAAAVLAVPALLLVFRYLRLSDIFQSGNPEE